MEALFVALGDERRIRILRLLVGCAQPMSQAEIRRSLEIAESGKSGVSRDVAQLVSAGLVAGEPRKRYTSAVTEDELEALLRQVAGLNATLAQRRVNRARRREREVHRGR